MAWAGLVRMQLSKKILLTGSVECPSCVGQGRDNNIFQAWNREAHPEQLPQASRREMLQMVA